MTLDLLSTENGTIAQKLPEHGPVNHIPVYSGNDDFTNLGEFRLQRIVFGGFNEALRTVYKKLYKNELKINMCGKPEKIAFEYAENHLK